MKAEASPAFGDDLELQGVDTAFRSLDFIQEPLHRRLNLCSPDDLVDQFLEGGRG